jgi:hypothetical protein
MKTLIFTANGFTSMVQLNEADINWLLEQLKQKYQDLTWEIK